MSKRKRHDIWQFFEIKDREPGKRYNSATCRFCQNEWKHGKVDDAIRHIAEMCPAVPQNCKSVAEDYMQQRNHYQIQVEDMGEVYPGDSVSQCSSNDDRKRRKRRTKSPPLKYPPEPREPEVTPDIMPDLNSNLATIQASTSVDPAVVEGAVAVRRDPELTALALNWFIDANIPFWHANGQTWNRLVHYLNPAVIPPSENELRAVFRDMYPDKQEPTRF